MAGINLHPYNLNNVNNNNPQEQKKMFSNRYGENYKLPDTDEEEEKEKQAAREKYFNPYGVKNTDPNEMNLDKPVQKVKSNNNNYMLIIGLGIGGIILIILFALL